MTSLRDTLFARLSAAVLCLFCTELGAAQAQNWSESRRTVSFVAGGMTTNGFDEVLNPNVLDYADNNFAGIILGYEVPIGDGRFSLGAEAQINQHFGGQEYLEFVVPATIRYSPKDPWVSFFDSFAFGLGLSYTADTPESEIARRGDSQRALVYFSLEAAFDVGQSGNDLFLRLHHRSDGYGLFETDTGSNAYALGFRKAF